MSDLEYRDDVTPPRLWVTTRTGHRLLLDHTYYTLSFELAFARWREEETPLIEAGKLVETRMDLLRLVSRVVTPANPEWTEEVIAERMSAGAMLWLLNFFVRLPGESARLAVEALSQPEPVTTTGSTTPPTPVGPGKGKSRKLAAVS